MSDWRFHDDFEATIRIYHPEEGGRSSPPFNGVRWDFAYADDSPLETLYGIHPDFFAPDGESLPTDEPLPVGVELPARLTVLNEKLRDSVHRARLAPGVRFFCHEGARRVAEGVVTRLTGLSQLPPV